MGDKADERIAIDFIDPLFAVALAANFTSLSAEPWFNCPTMIFTRENLFHVASLFLAYLTVILSWIGYHKSIRKKGIDVNHWAGEVRFFLDVLILIFYFILLEGYNDFGRELWVLVAIYVLFIFWDQMKRLEGAQEGKDSGSAARRGVTVVWFIVFLSVALLNLLSPTSKPYSCQDWLLWLVAIAGTFAYRKHKKSLWGKRMLLVLGCPRGNV